MGIEFPGGLQFQRDAEDAVCDLCSKLQSFRRRPGLKQQGIPLTASRQLQGATYVEELAVMIDWINLVAGSKSDPENASVE
jgi:hypothetical protein